MSIGPWQIIVVLLLVLLLFGGKRLARLGSDLGTGIRMFKRGLKPEARAESEEELPSDSDARKTGGGRSKSRRKASGGDVSASVVGSAAEVAKVARKVQRLRRFPFG